MSKHEDQKAVRRDRRRPLHRRNGENNDKIGVNFDAGAQSDRG